MEVGQLAPDCIEAAGCFRVWRRRTRAQLNVDRFQDAVFFRPVGKDSAMPKPG